MPATEPSFAAALSTEKDLLRASEEVSVRALAALGASPDLAMVFVSPRPAAQGTTVPYEALAADLCHRLGTQNLLGATGESIVGGRREIEGQPALSLWLASLPGAKLHPMHLEFQPTPEGVSFRGWPDTLPEPWPSDATLLLLGEPFSFPTDELLNRLNEDRPGVAVVGGMASGGVRRGENRLLFGPRELYNGAAAVLLTGVRLRTVVSQGCRPIGKPMVVTKAKEHFLHELGGRSPLAILQEIFTGLSPREQALVERGLHVGVVANEYQGEFRRGDFLVRNVIGADPQSGALAVGDIVRPGQTVQFHIRDAQSADEDLRELLAQSKASGASPRGGLLFTCNGRGKRLFDAPDHDAGAVCDAYGEIPLAGFFAQGEIGPIASRNHLHGFTASLALFE